MTMTRVQLFATAGPQAAGGQGPGMASGLDGLFAQLMHAPQGTGQPLTITDAANIAGNLPPKVTQNLPTDPAALRDLLNHVKQALDKGNVTEAASLLIGTQPSAEASDPTQQNLPTEAAPARIATAKVTARSTMASFQPQEVMALLQHESLVLQDLGYKDIDLTKAFDADALTEIYENSGLSHEEATARVDVIGKMFKHITETPDQPLVLLLPTSLITTEQKGIAPLPASKPDFLAAIEAAAQTIAPDSEDIVAQILSLDSVEGVDENGEPITKKVDVPIVQNIPVTNPQQPATAAETKTASEALADLALGGKSTGMQTRAAAPALEKSASTAEGQVVDNALSQQPSAHLLAAVDRSDVNNGVAAHSGAAVSVAAAYGQNDSSYSDADQRGHAAVEDAARINHEASAATFDRFLNQKLEAQVPVAATYNSHGKIPTPGEQVSVSVRQLAEAGGGEVRIKLMPEELGRVDIRLEIHNSQVRGVVMVERPEVLGDLARDLKHLQQALAATGLTMADNALSFQMQNQGGSQDDGRGHNSSAPLGGVKEVAANDDGTTIIPTGPWRDVTKLVDVNI